jgi:hypothetical protein
MVSPERLAEMRAFADEIRDDLELRLEQSPFDLPPEVTREAPAIIHKVTDNSAYHSAEPASPLNNDVLIDAIVEALAETRADMRREFEARIAMLEGQVTALLTLLGSDSARAKAVRNKRHTNVGGLLEAPRDRDRA